MKKFFTLMILSAFVAVSAFADDSSLGDVKWSIKDGAKINPAKTITLTFPNATGFEFGSTVEIACNLYAADEAPSEDNAFDGIEGTITDGVAFILPDFEVVESTKYILKVTSILVNGVEVIGDTVYTLNFATRGAERQLSWTFQIDENVKAKIVEDEGTGGEGTYWKLIKANERHYIHQSLKNSEIMLDASTPFPYTEDLTFTAGADKMFVGDLSGSFAGMLVFNSMGLSMTIPDCKVGDVITFSGVNATSGSASKQTCIFTYGEAIAPDGIESSRGVNDSIWVKAKGTYRFEAQVDGDITFVFSNFRMTGISITEAVEKVPCNYSVKAVYDDGESVKELKEIVPETTGIAGSVVKTAYPYWLADNEGNLYTHAATGKEFNISFDLFGDTVFYLNYAKAGVTDVVYLSEAEDWFDEENLESPIQLCTNENSAIRSSNSKAAYCAAEEGYQLTTLPAGKYKIRTVLFDANKTASYMPTFMVGSEEVTLSATATNFAEVESGVIEITEESPVILKQSGNDKQGIDIIAIYATDEMPEPDFQLGDANGDGEITMADANMVVNYFLAEDKDAIDNFHFEAADANEDGDITMADANKIVNIFLGTDAVVE